MRFLSRKISLFAAAVIFCGCNLAEQQSFAQTAGGLSVPKLFSDNMVLQERASAPIWGWGRDGETVTVRFRNKSISTRVQYGEWMVRLHHLRPGGPDTLTISSGGSTIELKNVLVGEIWVAGGQSNMEFPLAKSFNASGDIANSSNPMIRLLKVPRTRLESPTNDIGSSWQECTPDTTENFSAVAYYFARNLQKALNVPVGIIESDWGGTTAQAWMQNDFLYSNPRYRTEIIGQWTVDQDHYQRNLATYEQEKSEAKASGSEFTKHPPSRPWKPSELYNGMIAPIATYGIKGVLWYQGESNANGRDQAEEYRALFPDLIRDWRKVWGEGNFPFLVVQLAPFMKIQDQPSESNWALVREAQEHATQILPNVAMAVIVDVGNEHNIHPTKKEPVGERLAWAARGMVYHLPIDYSGPVYKRMKIVDSHIVLTFDHVGNGLVQRGDNLRGFAICGPDHKFVWADAEIQGKNKITVRNPDLMHPVAVRFGWANYPVVNLWNGDGFPASPFRTDAFDSQ